MQSILPIDPTTLHLGGEFAESNLGTAQELDGSLTVRRQHRDHHDQPAASRRAPRDP
jgi:hypothetical protein